MPQKDGFDVLTYKTVRSQARECYPLPNLQPVVCDQLQGDEVELPATRQMTGSWAVSFGMPSASPDVWRKDIEQTRDQLPAGKVLSVSVVGSEQPGGTLEDLADDYAVCAKWAVESGADVIIAHVGTTVGGSIGVTGAAISIEDAAKQTQAIIDAGNSVRKDVIYLSHGGPISSPEDAAYINEQTDTGGFVGASSLERMAVEESLTNLTRQFKSIPVKRIPARAIN